MTLEKSLQWRYACKAMDGSTLTDPKRNAILDAMRMAPTSLGVQPIKFVVVRDPEVKKDLAPIFNNQGQIEMSDSVVIIISKLKYDDEWLQHIMDNFKKIRDLDEHKVSAMTTGYKNYMSPLSDEDFAAWTMKQAYICLGFGLVAAADQQVHSTPMEGFDYDALNEYFGFKETGYQAAVAMVLGKSDPEHDYLAGVPKVRLTLEEMVIEK